jgi:hypothetical protein
MKKDVRLVVKITGDQQRTIETESKKQNINEPEYVRQAIEFYSSLDLHFLRHARATAEGLHLPFGVFIQQLLTTQMADDAANLAVNGEGTTETYARAFQFNERGLIQGREHFDLVFEEAKKEKIALRERLRGTRKAETSANSTKEEVAYMAAKP